MSAPTTVCLDASVVLAFALADEPLHQAAKALVVAFAAQNVTFRSPAIFAYECDSVIRLRVWKQTLTPAQGQLARAAIAALPIEIEFDAADRDRAFEIATLYAQPRAYDAAYAAHAQARGLEMVTTDAPFFAAVNGDQRPASVPPLDFVQLLQPTSP